MIKNYFKTAWRNLKKNRSYAFINIMGLSLSMACAILIFTLVKHHLGFDDFHQNSERIYRFVTEQHRDAISYSPSVPPPFGKAFRSDYDFAEYVARTVRSHNTLISIQEGDQLTKYKEANGASFAEPEFFEIFHFPLSQGDRKNILTEPNTAVITERLAEKYFGTQDVLNNVFTFENSIDFRITGVLKDIPGNTDLESEIYLSWATLRSMDDWYASDDAWGGISEALQCFALLKPNVTITQVEKILPDYVTKYRPKSANVHHYKLQPLCEMHFDGRYDGVMEKRNLWILSLIGVLLIITACVNFTNLATAQALKRAKEIGVRKVLGSYRAQIFWQFITETALITIVAAIAAGGLAYTLLPFVNVLFKTEMAIHFLSDPLLIIFIPALVLLVISLAGSYPGLILSAFRPISALKGKLSQQHIGGFNTRRALIITQFTISLICKSSAKSGHERLKTKRGFPLNC